MKLCVIGWLSCALVAFAQSPPMPMDIRSYESSETMKGGARQLELSRAVKPMTLRAVTPPALCRVTWCDLNPDVHSWEVWQSIDGITFNYLTTVTEPAFSTLKNKTIELFRVRNVHGWATNEPCP